MSQQQVRTLVRAWWVPIISDLIPKISFSWIVMRAQVSILLTIVLHTSATIFQASLQQLVRYVHPRSTWWQERNKIYIYNYTQDVHTVNRSDVVLQKPLYTSHHLLRLHYDSIQAGELTTRQWGMFLPLTSSTPRRHDAL